MTTLLVNKNDEMRDTMVHNAIRVVRIENSTVKDMDKFWLQAQRDIMASLNTLYEPMDRLDPELIIDWTNQLGAYLDKATSDIETLLAEQLSGLIAVQARILTNKAKRIYGEDIFEEKRDGFIQEFIVDPLLVNRILNAPSPWDGLRWMERFPDLTRNMKRRMRGAISRSITEGTGIPQARKGIQDAINLARERAEVIARTEIARVNNEIQRTIYDENKDVLQGIQYLAVLDKRTCMICGSDDGKIFYYKGSPSADNAPIVPRHGRCRCSYVPIVKEVPGVKKVVPERLNYRQWFDKQSSTVKMDILGPARFALYAKGRFTPNKFVNDGRILTLKELEITDFASGELARKEISALLSDLKTAQRLDDKKMVARVKHWLRAGGYTGSFKVSRRA